jgi:uncharacterized protein YlxW (UPF0749 family)
MRRVWLILAALVVLALALTSLVGCGDASTDGTSREDVEQTVDERLASAQEKVDSLADAIGELEEKVDGLVVGTRVEEIRSDLEDARAEAGAKKTAALEDLSVRLSEVIADVEAAAEKLPEGGTVRTELEDFVARLEGVKADIDGAIADL